ncbi:phospholipase D family protein [Ureibacillus sp. FSL W8-0352]|uniref:phospholipase D family protein n=2 Tax=unclassified Ureibacillus TaxID=2638520 RepID=UPI0030F8F073
MKLFKNNLEQELFKHLQMSKSKIIIISPYIGLNMAKKLLEIVKNKNLHCKIITRFERKAFIEKSSSLEALKLLIENNVQILALKDLHSKVYLIDGEKCFVGSANFTTKGLTTNHELLLYFSEETDVDNFNIYANELIKHLNGWDITIERIQSEQEFIEEYKEIEEEKEKINVSWGAELKKEKSVDENDIVLSVSAGDTMHLIEKYFVHAHPISRGYNYAITKYITFRKSNGGIMERIYKIEKSFSIEMKEWKNEINKLEISDSMKKRIANYIIDRYKDFEFNKAPKYKFYILSLLYDLPTAPKPPKNNTGGWLYTIKDLKESNGFVLTINQKKKNNLK